MTGVYVHIPFCLRKCLYCSFNSYSGMEEYFDRYADALLREAEEYEKQEAATIYFGGGTPTCLPCDTLMKIVKGLSARFPCSGEVTVEANPATVTKSDLLKFVNAGINRISIGIQSFDSGELLSLGRLHTSKDAEEAVLWAYEAGFRNISGDLMFAIPNQTMESLENTLEKMCSLPVTHISAYSLSVDEGTPFYDMKLSLPDEETERQMYYRITEMLGNKGFEHYEISNYAIKGFRSVHNTSYWAGREYIGLGAGAHSYFGGERYSNTADIMKYINCPSKKENVTVIDDREKRKEHYILGLRLLDGTEDIGHENVPVLIKQGLLERRGSKIRLTKKGLDLANYVFRELI